MLANMDAQLGPGFQVSASVTLVRQLGAGGMGSVWIAEHRTLHTQVVVKFMAPELAQDPTHLARFSREAAAASQVKSPHVVQIFDHGVTPEGVPYIVMELLEGHDLGAHMKMRRLSYSEIVKIVGQLAKALTRAHDRGIIHRDIKPENVFLCDTDDDEPFVKLLDFGIAKGTSEGSQSGLSNHTSTGSLVGSPLYMSPEQIIGAKQIDLRTDLWSLGVVTYVAVTGGRLPFEADNIGALALIINSMPPPVPSQHHPDLPVGFDAWFARACAKEKHDRFGSAKELAETLATALGTARPPMNSVIGDLMDKRPSMPSLPSSHPVALSATASPVSSSVPAPHIVARARGRKTAALVAAVAATATVAGFLVIVTFFARHSATTAVNGTNEPSAPSAATASGAIAPAVESALPPSLAASAAAAAAIAVAPPASPPLPSTLPGASTPASPLTPPAPGAGTPPPPAVTAPATAHGHSGKTRGPAAAPGAPAAPAGAAPAAAAPATPAPAPAPAPASRPKSDESEI